MIEKALELARRQVQRAEIALVRARSTNAEYDDDRLKHVQVTQSTQFTVRVIVNGRLGSARCTDEGALEAAVSRAAELAEFGTEAKFEFPGQAAFPDVKTYDPAVESITKEQLVAAGAEMLDLVKAYNDEIKVFGGASWHANERRLVNTSGLDITSQGSSHGIGIGGVLVRGTDMLYVYYDRGWRRPLLDTREVAERAIEQFRLAERTASLAPREMPVIFSPRGAFALLLSLLMGVNGKNVLKGDSPLADRLGDEIAAGSFSLIDDATVDYAPASGPCDDEGVARRRTAIVEDGRLASFLYDLETAGKAGVQSTGHGPGCETSNIMNGDFSVNVSLGYKIEKGEVVGRVKDVMLAGNAYEALTRIDTIGSEAEWTGPNCVPPIKIGALSVVAKA